MPKKETIIKDFQVNTGKYDDIVKNIDDIPEGSLVYTIDKNLPVPTKKDEGKVLTVNSEGEFVLTIGSSDQTFVYETFEHFQSCIVIEDLQTQTVLQGLIDRFGAFIDKENLRVGASIYIKEKSVPDYWLSDLIIQKGNAQPLDFFSELEAKGGGGGGGYLPTITLVAESPLEETIALSSEYSIKYAFTPSQGTSGTAKYYINGALKSTKTIYTGTTSFDVTKLLKSGDNVIDVVVNDIVGGTGTITFLIKTVELRLTSTFNDLIAYSGTIDFRYTPYGAVEKDVVFTIDDEVYTTEKVYSSGEILAKNISDLGHGVHKLKVSMSATIGETTIKSNVLEYNIIYVVEGNDEVLISSKFDKKTATQGELLSIDYIVYNPLSETTPVALLINDEPIQQITVGRAKQFWNLIDYPLGQVKFTIFTDTKQLDFNVTVEEADIDIEPVNTNLELYLSAKNRSNNEAEETRNKWVYKDITATLTNFNWSTNGWINDSKGYPILRVNGVAKVDIPFQIFATDFLSLGKTIEFDFATRNIYDINKVLVTSFSGDKGFEITSNSCRIKSAQSESSTKFKEDERVRVSFVIQTTSTYRLIKTFINGIQSGLKQYPVGDDFTQNRPVNISINPNEGDIDIYSIRVYNQDLNDKQMLNNYMYDLPLAEKIQAVTRNNILDDYGKVSYAKIKTLIPILTVNGAIPAWKGDKKNVQVTYENPFDANFNFTFEAVQMDIQGTSSQYYPRKNYKFKFPTAFSFYEGAVPEKTYTMKADFMESSHSHNTGNAILMNQLSPKFPTQEENNGVRNAIYGFPIAIFVKTPDAEEAEYYGIFNFNNDKGNSDTLGLTTPQSESWEFKNNTSARCNFRSNDFVNNVSDDFEARYPDKYTDYTNLSRVVSWVYSTLNNVDKFKNEFEQYFDKDFCLFYYVMMDVILAVDSRAKNMFLDTTDGIIWRPRWYDIDTSYGLNNEGVNQFSYGLEQHDFVDNVAVYNAENSLLWNNFELAFEDDIKEYYQNLRSSGKLSYEVIMDILKGHQIDKISEAMYNTDGEFKYIKPLTDSPEIGEDGEPIPNSTYLYVEQGSRLNHLQWWLNNRFRYLDSKYQYADYMKDYISMRTYTPTSYVVAPTKYFDLVPFTDMYLQVLFGSNNEIVRTTSGTTTRVSAPSDLTFNNTETIIYGASKILDVGDLSTKYARTMDFHSATKLKQLIIGNGTSGYQNTNLNELTIGNLKMLEKLDIQNCPNLTQTIDLSGCDNIREVYAKGTNISGVTLKEGGNLTTLQLPSSVTNLTLLNQPFLTNFSMDSYTAIKTIRIENVPNVNAVNILSGATNLERIRITNVNWQLMNNQQTILNRIINLRGLTETGSNYDKAVLTGKVHIKGQVGDKQILAWQEYFGQDLEITVDEIVPTYVVKFVNWDDTVLQTSYVISGGTVVYEGETPTRPDTDDGYTFEFIGWDKNLTNISSDLTIKANFKSDKPYIMKVNIPDDSLNCQIYVKYNYKNSEIDWGDGSTTITSSSDSYTHDYTSSGLYTIKVKLNIPANTKEIQGCGVTKRTTSPSSTYKMNQKLVYVDIPEGITHQTEYTFYYCPNVEYYHLPISLLYANNDTFGTSNVSREVYYEGTLEQFFNISVVAPYRTNKNYKDVYTSKFFVKEDNKFVQITSTNVLRNYENFTKLPNYAFSSILTDNKVIVPGNIKDIGNNAFEKNFNINEYVFEEGVENLGGSIMGYNNYGSDNTIDDEFILHIPKTLKSFNNYCFYDVNQSNHGKRIVYYNSTINDWAKIDFQWQYSYPFCNAYTGNATRQTLEFYCINEYGELYKPTEIKIEEGITEITKYTFAEFAQINYVELPSTITNIGETAFSSLGEYSPSTKTILKISAIIPPTLYNSNLLNSFDKIFVPEESVDKYKTATNWSSKESIIYPIVNYNVTFVNYDGTVLYTTKALEGQTISYKGETPIGPEGLEFFGWDNENFEINKDKIFTAVFVDPTTLTPISDFTLTSIKLNNVSGYKITGYNGTNTEINIPKYNTDGLPILSCASLNVSKITGMYIKDIDTFANNATVTEINFPNTISTSMNSKFYGCSNLKNIYALGTSNATNISDMFNGCKSLTTIPQLDTSKVTDMSFMFKNCTSLQTIPQLDTSKVTNITNMFQNCSSLTTIPQLDTSNVTNMTYLFAGCSSLTTIPQLDTSNVTNMTYLFETCSSLTTIPQLDTSNVNYIGSMFNGCKSLTTIPALDFSNVTSMSGTFNNCGNLKTLFMYGMKANMNITASTKFEREDLVTILNNLATVTSATLAIGTTNLAKLTNEDKAIATNKGWTLA